MIKLSKIPTTPPKGTEKNEIKKATKKMAKEIAELQYRMLAEGKKSILVIFQGMDSSGKDGATKITRSLPARPTVSLKATSVFIARCPILLTLSTAILTLYLTLII